MKLVILDRDGVINQDSDAYIKNPDEWIPIPGSLKAIAQLNHAGYRVVIATNQSGLARGLFNIDDLNAIHQKMANELTKLGGHIDSILFCPHLPDESCNCRKPQPGMLHSIATRLNMDLADVPFIGDSLKDLQAAESVGAKPILVLTGKGNKTLLELDDVGDVPVYHDLATAVNALISNKQ